MRTLAFASRNRKELLRDPLSLVFGVGLPLILLVFISVLQKSIVVDLFAIEYFAPGMAVFSLSFIMLFSGMLISKDRCSMFLMRLFSSPLRASDFIAGYAIPILPMGLAQTALCFAASILFGLAANARILLAMVLLIPVSVMYVGLGLLLGSLLSDKQVSGVCSLIVNVAALMSGTWFDMNMIGGTFKTIANLLPFSHAVDLARVTLAGDFAAIPGHLIWVIGYAAVIFVGAVLVFRQKMTGKGV